MPPVTDYDRLFRRIEDLEETVTQIRLSLATRDEGFRNTNIRLEKIEAILSRLTWLMVSSIVMAFAAFVIGGGLNLSTSALAAAGGF
jgi:hypothetical protein